jgi:hypothetical protein
MLQPNKCNPKYSITFLISFIMLLVLANMVIAAACLEGLSGLILGVEYDP